MSSNSSAPSSAPETANDGAGGGRGWLFTAVLPLLVALAVAGRARLNGDVTYAFGGMRVAAKGGVDIGDLFIARPYAYRVLISVLDDVRGVVTDDSASALAEWTIRLSASLLVLVVGWVLYLGLRRHLSAQVSAVVSLVVTASMVIAPPWHFLEPDWVGAVVGVAVVGLTLWPRRMWLGVVLGSVAVWLTIAMKTATFTWGLIGLVAVAVLAWRRALGALVGGLLLTVVWVGWMKVTGSWEWIWLQDQAKLVDSSPLNHGLQLADLDHLVKSLANVAIVSPILVGALPAAGVLIVRQQGRRRWWAVAILIVVAGLSVASAYGQGEWFMYHFAGTPIVAAGVWALAFATPSRARWALLGTVLVASIFSMWAMAQPLVWRTNHLGLVTIVLAVMAVLGLLLAVLLDRQPGAGTAHAGWWVLAAGLVAAVAFVTSGTPRATYSFDAYDDGVSAGTGVGAADPYVALRSRIGADTRVTYFAFGSLSYALQNPTTCRYPSPQWLQRAALWPRVAGFRSYADNLRCLSDDGGAQYLVWQPAWFNLARSSPEVRAYVAQFDCSAAGRLPSVKGVVVCPRKNNS